MIFPAHLKLTLLMTSAMILALPVGPPAHRPAGPANPSGAPAGTQVATGSADWTAVAASGKVEALGPENLPAVWTRVSRGDALEPLTHVRTDRRARATLSRDRDVILVDSGTDMVLPRRAGDDETSVRQNSGKVLFQIEPGTYRRLEVVTPYLVAGVKGTIFSVVVNRDFASVSVIEGLVEVRSLFTSEAVELGSGDMAIVSKREQRLEIYRGRGTADAPPSGSAAEPSADAVSARLALSREAEDSLKSTESLIGRTDDDTNLWSDRGSSMWDAFTRDSWDEKSLFRLDPDTKLLQEEQETVKNETELLRLKGLVP